MNDRFVIEQAAILGKSLLSQSRNRDQRIDEAFLRVLSRMPRETERQFAFAFLDSSIAQDDQAKWTRFCQALLCTAEFRLRP
jgi:hypothetical protein